MNSECLRGRRGVGNSALQKEVHVSRAANLPPSQLRRSLPRLVATPSYICSWDRTPSSVLPEAIQSP